MTMQFTNQGPVPAGSVTNATTLSVGTLTVTGTTLHTGAVTNSARVADTPGTPTALSADVNNYAGFAAMKAARLASDQTNRVITGIVAGAAGDELEIFNINTSAYAIKLKHNSASSSAANRIFCSLTGDDVAIPAGQSAKLRYDGTSALWRVLSISGSKVTSRQTIFLGVVRHKNATANDIVCKTYLPGPARIIKFWTYPANKTVSGGTGAHVYSLKQGATELGMVAVGAGATVSSCGQFSSGTSTNTIDSAYADQQVVTVVLKTATTAFNSSGMTNFYCDIIP